MVKSGMEKTEWGLVTENTKKVGGISNFLVKFIGMTLVNKII